MTRSAWVLALLISATCGADYDDPEIDQLPPVHGRQHHYRISRQQLSDEGNPPASATFSDGRSYQRRHFGDYLEPRSVQEQDEEEEQKNFGQRNYGRPKREDDAEGINAKINAILRRYDSDGFYRPGGRSSRHRKVFYAVDPSKRGPGECINGCVGQGFTLLRCRYSCI